MPSSSTGRSGSSFFLTLLLSFSFISCSPNQKVQPKWGPMVEAVYGIGTVTARPSAPTTSRSGVTDTLIETLCPGRGRRVPRPSPGGLQRRAGDPGALHTGGRHDGDLPGRRDEVFPNPGADPDGFEEPLCGGVPGTIGGPCESKTARMPS